MKTKKTKKRNKNMKSRKKTKRKISKVARELYQLTSELEKEIKSQKGTKSQIKKKNEKLVHDLFVLNSREKKRIKAGVVTGVSRDSVPGTANPEVPEVPDKSLFDPNKPWKSTGKSILKMIADNPGKVVAGAVGATLLAICIGSTGGVCSALTSAGGAAAAGNSRIATRSAVAAARETDHDAHRGTLKTPPDGYNVNVPTIVGLNPNTSGTANAPEVGDKIQIYYDDNIISEGTVHSFGDDQVATIDWINCKEDKEPGANITCEDDQPKFDPELLNNENYFYTVINPNEGTAS